MLTVLEECVVKELLKKARDYSYEELLDRAFSKIPVRDPSKGVVFELPSIETIAVGTKTIVKNFRNIAHAIGRDDKLLMKYLVKELAAAGSIDEAGNLILSGRFSAQVLDKLLKRFVDTYVKCPTCSSIHTVLEKSRKTFKLKCLACSAETTLPSF